MEFRGMEGAAVDVLSTPELQRLRHVKHLGLVYLVFPGGEHSRFTHSVGAAHLMARFASSLVDETTDYLPAALQPDETTVRDLVLAALCHDLGHGPLSHAWEHNVIGSNFHAPWSTSLGTPDEEWIQEITKWHELVAQAFLLGDTRLHEMLERIDANLSTRVAALLGRRYYLPYLTSLLSSDIDVDRCDFILRDAYQTGVAHGRYDLDWLVSTATVGNRSDGRPVVGFDSLKAPRVVEQLLIARRALYDNVTTTA
jgi:HD superfamily phosphohydrolase